MITRVQQWIVLAALAISAAACGNSMSATGPSGGSGGGSGAIISGRVAMTGSAALPVAARFPLALAVAVPLANSNSTTLTVSVVGTNITSTVDGSGSFTLNGVPPGTVQLRFQGRGADATITIAGVEADDRLDITVTLNGQSARLDSRKSNGNGNSNGNGVLVNGRIDSINSVTRRVQVGTDTVIVDNGTVIRHGNRTLAFSDLRTGDRIQVKGSRTGAMVTASEIKVETGDDEDDDDDRNGDNDLQGAISGLGGTCPSVTFFVQSTKVTTNGATRFEDVTCLTLANNQRVEVTGTRANDGSIVATKVERD